MSKGDLLFFCRWVPTQTKVLLRSVVHRLPFIQSQDKFLEYFEEQTITFQGDESYFFHSVPRDMWSRYINRLDMIIFDHSYICTLPHHQANGDCKQQRKKPDFCYGDRWGQGDQYLHSLMFSWRSDFIWLRYWDVLPFKTFRHIRQTLLKTNIDYDGHISRKNYRQ